MKLIILSLLINSSAFATTCDTDELKSKLVNLFKVNNAEHTSWTSVSDVDSYEKDHGLPVVVEATSNFNTSTITYKKDLIPLEGIKICSIVDKKDRTHILLKHPAGELIVKRRGNGLDESIIKIKIRRRPVTIFLRPTSEVVEDDILDTDD